MNYDTGLFIEIIESIQGIVFMGADCIDGYHSRFYQGLKGKRVMIDTTMEDIPESVGIGYLNELGLGHLIPSLFPKEPAAVEAVGEEEE